MNQRKLIKLGNSSYAIALPKDWIDKAGLKKGDNVYIMPNSNGELIIHPTLISSREEKEQVIILDNLSSDDIGRSLVSSYVRGSKLIRAKGEKQQLKIIKQKAKTFLNLEPIEESGREILLKDLLDIEDVGLENFMRRMDNNLREMFSIIANLAENSGNFREKIREIEEIDRDITKFYFLIWRFVNLGVDNPSIQANIKISPSKLVEYFWISYNLEQIGDELKRIAAISQNEKIIKEIAATLAILYENYEKSMDSFFKANREIALGIISNNRNMIESIESLSKKKELAIVCEKLQLINAGIYRNSKMVYYNP